MSPPDPLSHLHLFGPYQGKTIHLPDVTTITVDDRSDTDTTGRIAAITKWHRRFLRPAEEVILSGAEPDVEGVTWISLPKWKTKVRSAYSLWCQKELRHFFKTPMVMIWQTDGFAVNPEHWSNDYLKCDYIGAPFCMAPRSIGNGGFCMRSMKFCAEVAKLPDCGEVPEDIYFCRDRRADLERSGVSFAPFGLAERWSTEKHPPNPLIGRTFGFHAKHSMPGITRWITENWLTPFESKTLKNGLVYRNGKLMRP